MKSHVSKLPFRLFCLGLLIFLFLPTKTFSQKKSLKDLPAPRTWGILKPHEYQMTHCPFDSSATAVVLSDFGEWKLKSSGKNLGYKAILNRHVRIKILAEGGFEHANGAIPYISLEKLEKLSNFEAHTINNEGGKVVYYPIEKDGKGEEDVDGAFTEFKFAFPRVQVGSILEYKYTLTTANIYTMEPWDFQNDIPTMRSEVRLISLKNLDHSVILYHLTDDSTMENRWVMENIPALVEEPFVNNMENYRARLTFDLKDYKKSYYSQYGSVTYKSDIYKTWDQLRRGMTSYPPTVLTLGTGSIKKRSTSDSLLKATVLSLIEGTTDTIQQIQILYNFVRDSIRWDGDMAVKASPYLAYEYFEEGTGNSAQINMALHQVLGYAGIPSAPLLVGTIDHGLPIYNFPVSRQFNEVITVAQTGGKTFLLNAIDSLRPFNYPAMNDLAQSGFLLNGQGSGWFPITNNYLSQQKVLARMTLSPDGELTGKVTETYTGYYALAYRTELIEGDGEETFWEDRVDESLATTTQENQEISEMDNPEKPLKLSYEVTTSDFSNVAGDYIYFKPLMDFAQEANPFINPERKYDVEMGCLHRRKVTSIIEIPEGYEVESLPEPARVILPEKSMVFQYSIAQNLNQIQVLSIFQTSKATFSTGEYYALKELYDHMVAKQIEQVVLRKKE